MKIKIIFIFCFMVNSLWSDNWNTWRGPEQNSISQEKNLKFEKLYEKKVWEKNVGTGYSTVSVYNDRLLTAGFIEGKDYIYCLNAKTGKENWVYSHKSEEGSEYPGTRSTPVTDGKNVYQFSRAGLLVCLDLGTGKLKWQVDVIKDYGAENIRWGIASTPILVDNKVIIGTGRYGMAFDKEKGTAVWKNIGGAGNRSSVKPFIYKKKKYIAYIGQKDFFILDAKSGNVITFVLLNMKWNIVGIDPVVNKDGSLILISSAYNIGSTLYKFDGKTLKQIWQNKNMCAHFSTPILIENKIGEGTLYGVNGNAGRGRFCAVDFKTGKTKWKAKVRFGNFIMADNKIIHNTERGKLVVIKPNPDKYEEIISG